MIIDKVISNKLKKRVEASMPTIVLKPKITAIFEPTDVNTTKVFVRMKRITITGNKKKKSLIVVFLNVVKKGTMFKNKELENNALDSYSGKRFSFFL
ncbi:MAG: hypothetical protein WEA59_05060 [Ferruginibacter sp.]